MGRQRAINNDGHHDAYIAYSSITPLKASYHAHARQDVLGLLGLQGMPAHDHRI